MTHRAVWIWKSRKSSCSRCRYSAARVYFKPSLDLFRSLRAVALTEPTLPKKHSVGLRPQCTPDSVAHWRECDSIHIMGSSAWWQAVWWRVRGDCQKPWWEAQQATDKSKQPRLQEQRNSSSRPAAWQEWKCFHSEITCVHYIFSF